MGPRKPSVRPISPIVLGTRRSACYTRMTSIDRSIGVGFLRRSNCVAVRQSQWAYLTSAGLRERRSTSWNSMPAHPEGVCTSEHHASAVDGRRGLPRSASGRPGPSRGNGASPDCATSASPISAGIACGTSSERRRCATDCWRPTVDGSPDPRGVAQRNRLSWAFDYVAEIPTGQLFPRNGALKPYTWPLASTSQ